MLAIYYGDAALELMRTHGREVGAVAGRAHPARRPSLWWLRGQAAERARARLTPGERELSIVIPLRDEEPNVVAAARRSCRACSRRWACRTS